MLADHSTSDVTVVEFPLMYYLVSFLYRLFGVHELWYRLFQVAIGFMGLFFLFKASFYFTRDWFYAAAVPLIIFTSPIYVYYLNNFIPDAVALSLTFGGFYYFTRYMRGRRFRPWLVSMIFFLLAGLTKISSLLPYLALGCLAVVDLASTWKNEKREKVFSYRFKFIASYLSVLLLIFGWYLYARIYSDVHGGSVSAVEIRPIWELSPDTIQVTLHSMKNWFRRGDYHATNFLYLSLVIFILNIVFHKKANRFLLIFSLLVFLGAFSFTALFFQDMRNHDYYQINNLFLLVPVFLTFFSILSYTYPGIYRSVWTKVFLGGIFILLLANCMNRIQYRYSEKDMHYVSSSRTLEMFDIEDKLEELGIGRNELVFCTPDRSINISLYLCNRKGLTDYSEFSSLPFEERIEKMKETGIEYVILGSREPYREVNNLEEILGHKLGEADSTEIFKLEQPKPNEPEK